MYKTDNQFILYVAETENMEIKIALRFPELGEMTDFFNLGDTAFVLHPQAKHLKTNDFGDWYLAFEAKRKWNLFLERYLDKEV